MKYTICLFHHNILPTHLLLYRSLKWCRVCQVYYIVCNESSWSFRTDRTSMIFTDYLAKKKRNIWSAQAQRTMFTSIIGSPLIWTVCRRGDSTDLKTSLGSCVNRGQSKKVLYKMESCLFQDILFPIIAMII